ncbi:MAG: M24 family metallopeptidase, partial [Anaerolineae bacterium]|nr:M24 family metallopeptidase [Anaerolineae bacterium]
LDGYYADTAATIAVTPVTGIKQKLAETAHAAMEKGISVATAGNKVNEIGRAMESVVRGAGFSVIRDLPGHGVGRKLHESPSVPGFYNPRLKDVLKEGMVLTVEPFVSTKAKHIFTEQDGWTLKTPDGSPAAQYEHTLVITKGAPIRITQVI